MTELILKKLDRGFILKDFDGNEIGIKDSEQAIDEIKKLVKPYKKVEQHVEQPTIEHVEQPIIEHVEQPIIEHVEQPIIEHVEQPIIEHVEQPIIETTEQTKQPIIHKYVQKKRRYNDRIELNKDILEKAKEQISLFGNINESDISKELGISNSIVNIHLKILRHILDELMLSIEKGPENE